MKKPDSDTVSVTVLLMGSASGIYAMLCPSLFTSGSSFFHQNGEKEHNIKNMRIGYGIATVLTLIMGVGASKVEDNLLPLIGAAVVGGIAIAGYEFMMANGPDNDQGSPSVKKDVETHIAIDTAFDALWLA